MNQATPHPLLTQARRAIAQRREQKATALAWFAWSLPSGPITSEMMQRAKDHEWRQLVEAARIGMKQNYGVPSIETKALVISKLREYESRKG